MPPKDKVAAWRKLRKEQQDLAAAWATRRRKGVVAARHEHERLRRDAATARQIAKLEAALADLDS